MFWDFEVVDISMLAYCDFKAVRRMLANINLMMPHFKYTVLVLLTY